MFLFQTACSSLSLTSEVQSGLDQQFRLQRLQHTSSAPHAVEVNFYRRVLGRTLYSSCRWFPSDSEYVRLKSLKCSFAKGFLGGYARFLNEPDAANMGYPVILTEKGTVFVDVPDDCEQI